METVSLASLYRATGGFGDEYSPLSIGELKFHAIASPSSEAIGEQSNEQVHEYG